MSTHLHSPLMSLASTIHVTVRQKGRFGDSYIGYVAINPGSFKINPEQVTHWHKLGAKPGKPSTKLRGDLQVTFQFLSKWSGSDNTTVPGHLGMLKHSSSDLKISTNMRHTNSDEALSTREGQSKTKILSSLRRSFRRKTKTPAVQTCTDDFASFTSHSASSTPQNIRKRTGSLFTSDHPSNSLPSANYLSNGLSDSDTGNSASQSPPPMSRVCRTSESEDGSLVTPEKERDVLDAQDGKLVSYLEFTSSLNQVMCG